MPKAAYNGVSLTESTKIGYVSYVERYRSGTDSDGNPQYRNASYQTDAKITGNVNASSNVYINGSPAVTVGDSTTEQWTADPAPYAHNGGTITSISPGTSGSGSGTVTIGSSNVFVNGKPLAYEGSTVTTHLGNTTTIAEGSNNVFVN
ncbi:PAAR motif protein [compost metagenome]